MRLRFHADSPFCRKILAMIRYRHDRVSLHPATTIRDPRIAVGALPVLETRTGAIVDLAAIAAYLDSDSGLLIPSAVRREVVSMDRLIDLFLLESVVTLRCEPNTEAAEQAVATAYRALTMLDTSLEHGPWVCGETFTLCDIGAAVGTSEVVRLGLELPDRVASHLARVCNNTVVGVVIEEALAPNPAINDELHTMRMVA